MKDNMSINDVQYLGIPKEKLKDWTIGEYLGCVEFVSPDKKMEYMELRGGGWSLEVFNDTGNLIEYKDSENAVITYKYDNKNNLIFMDHNGKKSYYLTDSLGTRLYTREEIEKIHNDTKELLEIE
jgi:YD repeat-containing protein